jgi:hypothetical protein
MLPRTGQLYFYVVIYDQRVVIRHANFFSGSEADRHRWEEGNHWATRIEARRALESAI